MILSKRTNGMLLAIAFIILPISLLTWISSYSEPYKHALGWVFESNPYKGVIGDTQKVVLIGRSSNDATSYRADGAKRRVCITYQVLLIASEGEKFAEVVIRSDDLEAMNWKLVGIAADGEPTPPCKYAHLVTRKASN